MKLFHQITYFLLSLLKKWTSFLSPKTRYRFANRLAGIIYRYIPVRQDLAHKNIKIAFPEWSHERVEKTIKNTYQFFTHNFVQFLAFPKSWDGVKLNASGIKLLDNSLEQKKGIIMISAHFGTWELFVKWVGNYWHNCVGIVHRQNNRGADRFAREQRELCGVKHIFRKEPIEKMYNVLSQNGIFCLVSDQDAKNTGVFVDFFGKPASTHKGAALFHMKTKSPIIFGVCIQTGFQQYQVEFLPVIPKSQTIKDITQAYTSILEKIVRQHPEQYFWFHRRWKTKPISE
jgi:KDO2-lipid IV(A) lauroyltransferase